jgi:excisionase family DNA binding protein
MPDENKHNWLTANQAGKVLGVSGRTVIRMMEDGDLPGYKIGSVWKFKQEDVDTYIESRRFQGNKADTKSDKSVA